MNWPNEAAFQDSVVDLAKMAGWLVHHDRMKQNVLGHPGFPDLCLVREGYVIFAELKMDGKEPTEDQQRWLDTALLPLTRLSIPPETPGHVPEVFVRSVVWHPSDWERIVKILTTRR